MTNDVEQVDAQQADIDGLPKHIAIIMDGNNRYAKAHGLATGGGHIAGKQSLDPLVEHCARIGVKALTVFAFSSENWQRPANEVALLMQLLEQTIQDQLPRMFRHQIAYALLVIAVSCRLRFRP